jgi:hypothetical protein
VQVEPWFKYAQTWDIQRWALHLDEATHKDYAEKLIPRAVGYSAALLDYFFRGDIRLEYQTTPTPGYVIVNKTKEDLSGLFQVLYDNKNDQRFEFMSGNFGISAEGSGDRFDIRHPSDAKEPGKYILVFKGNMGNERGAVAGYVVSRLLEITPPEQFIYSMDNGDALTPQFTEVKVKVRNKTNETMQNGTLQAIAKYKKTIDDPDYLYMISLPKSGVTLTDTSQEISFDFRNSPIPVDATDLFLEIVFKGTIGSEQNAVAVGIKDISEPTPIGIFNNMDRICIKGKWYIAGSLDAYNALPETAKWWDYWPHNLENVYVKVSPRGTTAQASVTDYTFFAANIEPGSLYQRFILSEYEFAYSDSWQMAVKHQSDNFIHENTSKMGLAQGVGVRNQKDYSSDPGDCSEYGKSLPCTIPTEPFFYIMRGVQMWGKGGFIVDGITYPNYTDPGYVKCSWDALKQ